MEPSPTAPRRTQSRLVATLSLAQVFSGLGNGSTLALGSLLAVALSGSDAWAGSVNTALTLGTATTAIPLSTLALARGRRVALTTGLAGAVAGNALLVAAVLTASFALVLAGAFLVGLASAVNLQARFAATDLADPAHRGRDLSLVVWAITVGAVTGPNLVVPGAALAGRLGLPALAGPFLLSAAGTVLGAAVLGLFLRPDPLLTRRTLDLADPQPGPTSSRPWQAGWRIVRAHPSSRAAVLAVVAAHAVMVAVMSMTPLHLQHRAGPGTATPDTIALIGATISLHIAGMYAASPLFGWLTDRLGPARTVRGGLGTLLAATALTGLGASHLPAVTAGLILLGLGWSAVTVAGSTLLVAFLDPAERVPAQGFSDATMSLAGALASAAAGPIMGGVGYAGASAAAALLALAATGALLHLSPARP